jgi:mannosyl-3-phosphoglycerate phosphatase
VSAPLLVATDLDGTLLDTATYSWEPAREALEALRARGVPLVLCSSKTRAELEPLARELGAAVPLIVENGGALVTPGDDGGRVDVLGTPRDELVRALRHIASESGTRVRGFSALSVGELAELTGLDPEAAARALQREFDEPFLLDDAAALPRLVEAADRRGLRITDGGRFLHLGGPTDKGRAVREWLRAAASEGRCFSTVGLGDAASDVPLLRAVDRPILMPRAAGGVEPALLSALPEAEIAPEAGPAGWNQAVLAVLEGERLAQA